jgi:predicted benzoate:H+ symporter BenE
MGGVGIILGFIGFFGLCSALIGLIIGLVGFSKKNYKLTKKGKK